VARNAGHISLIIKGPRKSATRAAQRHGLNLSSCRDVGSRAGAGEAQCYTPCTPSTNKKIVEWFSERSRLKAARGFPPGTLLYHGAFCETKNLGKRAHKRRR
jgi:hypothetical protein